MRKTWADNATSWVAFEAMFDSVLSPVTAAILETAAMQEGERILDVGCGAGTLLEAASEVGADPVGVDISEAMGEGARRRAPKSTVLVADAQDADLLALAPGRPFDRVISRFGVMFFADPTAAFANIRGACASGAALTFVCWRGADENPMFTCGSKLLVDRMDPKPEPTPPGAPGPRAFADPERIRSVLGGSGWESVEVTPFDFVCDFGFDGSDGVKERLGMILGTADGRAAMEQLQPRLGEDGWTALIDEIREYLESTRIDGSVRFPGATWLVTARNAGA